MGGPLLHRLFQRCEIDFDAVGLAGSPQTSEFTFRVIEMTFLIAQYSGANLKAATSVRQ